jgi:regulator of replication initiation timing
MESKGYKRFATTEAEIEEKRLKSNAERTIKQNKAAENGKNIGIQLYCNVYHVCSVIYYARYLNWGIMSPMAIGWLFLEHSHQHKLWRVI